MSLLWAQGQCSSTWPDTKFPIDQSSGIIYITKAIGGSIVGNTINQQSDANPSALDFANNVVSKTAYLSITDGIPGGVYGMQGAFVISVNGHLQNVFYNKAAIPQTQIDCIAIDSSNLNFAQIAPAGQSPTNVNGLAGANQINIQFFGACTYFNQVISGPCPINLGVAALSVDSMAPIMMVHGINTTYKWFTTNNFTSAFSGQNLPFAAVAFDATPIEDGTKFLGPKIASLAQQFGASHVHIIAHSKGGLWSRDFLSNISNFSGLGVFSLQTLDTLHLGSVSADISVAANQGADITSIVKSGTNSNWYNNLGNQWAVSYAYKKTNESLTTAWLQATYNPTHASLPQTTTVDGQSNRVNYFAYEGDTNLGGSKDSSGFGIIDCSQDPCSGFPFSLSNVAQTLYRTTQAWSSVSVTKDNQGRVVAVPKPASQPYDGNDLIVTVKSATFQAPFFSRGVLKVNHTTIGYSYIGQQIAQFMVSQYRMLQGN